MVLGQHMPKMDIGWHQWHLSRWLKTDLDTSQLPQLYSMMDTTTARYICSLLCSVIRGCLKHIAQSEWNAAVLRLQR